MCLPTTYKDFSFSTYLAALVVVIIIIAILASVKGYLIVILKFTFL